MHAMRWDPEHLKGAIAPTLLSAMVWLGIFCVAAARVSSLSA